MSHCSIAREWRGAQTSHWSQINWLIIYKHTPPSPVGPQNDRQMYGDIIGLGPMWEQHYNLANFNSSHRWSCWRKTAIHCRRLPLCLYSPSWSRVFKALVDSSPPTLVYSEPTQKMTLSQNLLTNCLFLFELLLLAKRPFCKRAKMQFKPV